MNYGDERWVKLYTRDTASWLLMGWEAQAVLMQLMRRVDRAGVLNTAGDPVGFISLLCRMPKEIVQIGYQKLVEMDTVSESENAIVLVNFLEAQENKTSDAEKQRRRRERRESAVKVLKTQESVSPDVTACHRVSPAVTTRLDVTSLDYTKQEKTPLSDFGNPTAVGGEKKQTPANEVFEFWKETFGKNAKTIFDAKRRYAVEKQLRNGFSVEDLKLAIVGCSKSPHHMGENDRGEKYNDLELICRDAPRVEKFIEIASGPAKTSAKQEAEVWR